jgi:hypothetical protein
MPCQLLHGDLDAFPRRNGDAGGQDVPNGRVERQPPADYGLGERQCGESLSDRADLEGGIGIRSRATGGAQPAGACDERPLLRHVDGARHSSDMASAQGGDCALEELPSRRVRHLLHLDVHSSNRHQHWWTTPAAGSTAVT